MLMTVISNSALAIIPLVVVSVSVASTALLLAAVLVSRPQPPLYQVKQTVRR